MKLQLSLEFTVIVGLILIIILPIIFFLYQKNIEIADDSSVVKLKYGISNLKTTIDAVIAAKGEIKTKIVVPASSYLGIKKDGSVWLLYGSVASQKGSNQISSIIPETNEILLNNTDSRLDSEYIIRVYYNDSINKVNVTIFG